MIDIRINPKRYKHGKVLGTLLQKDFEGLHSCVRNKVNFFEASQNGIWNKISRWIGTIKKEMNRYHEHQCQMEDKEPTSRRRTSTPQKTTRPTSSSTTSITTTATKKAIH